MALLSTVNVTRLDRALQELGSTPFSRFTSNSMNLSLDKLDHADGMVPVNLLLDR